MRKKISAFLLAMSMLTAFSSCSPAEPVIVQKTSSVSEALQKPDVGENYYGYVNFEYLTEGQIPYDRSSYGTFENIQDEMEDELSEIIDGCSQKKSPSDTFEKAVKEVYEQYLDYDSREKAGIDILMPAIQMVEECQTTESLVNALGVIYQEYGVSSFFRFSVQPDSYDTSVPKLTMNNINTCGNMKENFTKTENGSENIGSLTQNILTALDVELPEAKERAKNAVSVIYGIMSESLDSSEMLNIEKHYNLYTKEEFAKLFSNVDTDNLMKQFGFNVDDLVVYDIPQAEKVNEYFTQENLRALKDYTLTCIAFEYSSALPPSYMEKFSEQKNNKKNPEKSAKTFVYDKLEEELGILYGRKIFTDEVISSANTMLSDLKKSCRELIQNSERLSDDSKKKFLSKLDNMIFLLGYNKNYQSPFEITPAKEGGNLLQNMVAVNKGNTQREIQKLSKKVDRNTWDMTPITVNAVYNPYVNTVTIPAVMLSKTSFDPAYSEYKNLGMLGYVIAHEMNHAFDSNGFRFDENGCYNPNWMNDDDKEAYQKLMDKAEDYYSNYKVLDIYNINGKQTLSENIADLGAVQCIANITDDKEELRQIFEGVASQWASLKMISDVVQQLAGDEHSPDEARVNAVLSSIDKFYEAYDIKETDKMYMAPENRIKVW